MAQPSPYDRDFDFQGFQSSHPETPIPGDKVNAELDAIAAVLDEVLVRIALIQRDDLEIANLSIGYDQLAVDVRNGFTTPTLWASGTAYETNDSVYFGRKVYAALADHTSGTFSLDLAAGKWHLLADFTAVTEVDVSAEEAMEAAQLAATQAAASASSAATSESNAASAQAAAEAAQAAVEAVQAELDEFIDLPRTDGGFIVGDGSVFTVESGDTVRLSLGLGSAAVVDIIDDDTFATATATNIPSAESVAAYALAKSANLFDVADVSLALENLGVEIRQGYYFGISAANGAAANDTAFAAAMTWLNGASRRAIRLPSGILNVSVTPITITGTGKYVFGQGYGTTLRMAGTATDGSFIEIGDGGSTTTNQVGVSGISLEHLATTELSNPAIVIEDATDVVVSGARCATIPGLVRISGSCSRIVVRDFYGSMNLTNANIDMARINPGAGDTTSLVRLENIDLLDGVGSSSANSIIRVAPSGGGLFDTLWVNNVHSWSLAGMAVGIDINVTGGSAVNMWFQNCCTDKSSTAGIRIQNTGTQEYRARNIRFSDFRADCNNGGKNVLILNSNSHATSRIQGIVFDGAMFPYQTDDAVDVQNTGSGIMDGIAFDKCVFHEFGSATKTAVMYFDASGWSVTNCHFNEIGSTGSTAFAVQTAPDATDFVVANNIVTKPTAVLDFSQYTTLDDQRVVHGNTGTGEPWALGRDLVMKRLASAEANVGSTQTDVAGLSYTLPTMMLVPGPRREFRMEFVGVLAANGNTKTVDVDFGAGTVEIFSNAKNNVRFSGVVTAIVTNTDTATIDWDVQFADASESVGRTQITIDTDASQLLRMRLTGSANADINLNRGRLLLG